MDIGSKGAKLEDNIQDVIQKAQKELAKQQTNITNDSLSLTRSYRLAYYSNMQTKER